MIKYTVFKTVHGNFIIAKVEVSPIANGSFRLNFQRGSVPHNSIGYIPYSMPADQVFDTYSEAEIYAASQADKVKEKLISKIKFKIEYQMKQLAKAESYTPKITKRINLVK